MSSNPKIPQADSRCHFWRLPGEVRNLIYAYTLSENVSLRYSRSRSGRGSIVTAPKEFTPMQSRELPKIRTKKERSRKDTNQLKFVSRQLYKETRGLILRYNDITFTNIEDLATFLNSCPSWQYAHLKFLDVDRSIYNPTGDYYDGNADAVEHVFEFCRHNPHVLVQNCPIFRTTSAYAIIWAARLQMHMRKSTQLLEVVVIQPHIVDRLLAAYLVELGIGSVEDIPGNVPPNFRLRPKERVFDEKMVQAFRQECLENEKIRDSILPRVIGGVEHWVTVLKTVVEHGI